ncbi:GYD domain-containing protein [Haladaptatus pallidirubidus]|uniref:GYD domain-containing protein n=1 Tax=Haladaptatus pallidirubidus TaxID=1008152 RepID=UPI001D12F7F4|nr:GYD domain-containing protein [Haladaptatus pallidirubidus]
MAKYVSLIKIRGSVQNAQKLASSLGNLATEVQEYDAEIEASYAILGEYDFMVVFDAPDRNAAFRASIAIENQGLDTQTMEIVPVEEFAGLVED